MNEVIQQLNALGEAAKDMTPEQQEKLLEDLRQLPPSALQEFEKVALGSLAASGVTPEAFIAFYKLVHGNDMPEHLQRAVDRMFAAHEAGRGFLTFMSRGFWKTTTLSQTFDAFLIGHHPEGTGLVIGANDDSAEKITKAIAQIIEFNPNWKYAFEHVVPDPDRGWAVGGFWVRDNRMTRSEWAKQQSAIIDPTFVGGGYKSSRLNGKHPSLFLNVDDIHDRENSVSEAERYAVVETAKQVILKTILRDGDKIKTWVNFIGVPWSDDDLYHELIRTGQYEFVRVPCMTKAPEGIGTYIDGVNPSNGVVYDDIKGWWVLEWPDHFGVQSVIYERAHGKPAFWQMNMLDIKEARSGGLFYHSYDHTKIEATWLHAGGSDFATLGTLSAKADKGRDKFALAIGAKTPYNQIVVEDGYFEQVTQAMAENYLSMAQRTYRVWRGTMFETTGSGEQFYLFMLQRNPGLLLHKGSGKGRNKLDRIRNELGPWLENGSILISDADTPFLRELRRALEEFPDGNDDILDALYYLALEFQEALVTPSNPNDGLPSRNRKKRGLFSPWAA